VWILKGLITPHNFKEKHLASIKQSGMFLQVMIFIGLHNLKEIFLIILLNRSQSTVELLIYREYKMMITWNTSELI
jgi:hypothetical protein